MNLRNLISLIVIFATGLLGACKTFKAGITRGMMYMYGIDTSPDKLSKTQVFSYANKYNIDTSGMLLCNPEMLLYLLRIRSSPNQAILFNRDGLLLVDTTSCSGTVISNLDSLLHSNQVNNKCSIDSLLSLAQSDPIATDILANIRSKGRAYYAVVTWASYAGRLNKTVSGKALEKLMEIRKNYDVQIICINMDLLKEYEYQKLILKNNKPS
jgi:hypothetical protein